MSEDELDFFDDDDCSDTLDEKPWKIMIVDDEDEVHNVTRLVLGSLSFQGKPIQLLSARSGAEAKRMISDNPDTALMLLDVIMETEQAGLDVARYIRDDIKNKFVRIVMRTGQPGTAPEKDVIDNYDINDYKDKTELTSQKLYTLMYSSLRSYRDIVTIEENKKGLMKIISATKEIFQSQSLDKFAAAVLNNLASLLDASDPAVFVKDSAGMVAHEKEGGLEVLASTGDYKKNKISSIDSVPKDVQDKILETLSAKKNQYFEDSYVAYFKSKSQGEHLLYIKTIKSLSDVDKHLVEVFCSNIAIAFENIYLNKEIEATQREIVYKMGEAVESRSKETGYHVKRVALISYLLALKYGKEKSECDIIQLASPMHDLGKICIPDKILNKPGKLDADELDIMKSHAIKGYEILKGSGREVLETASIIARDHHEKWDGSGYPAGKSKEEITFAGRVTAVADIFDALLSERCYKKPWPLKDVVKLFEEEKGKHFEPKLVEILLNNLEEFVSIRDNYKDSVPSVSD